VTQEVPPHAAAGEPARGTGAPSVPAQPAGQPAGQAVPAAVSGTAAPGTAAGEPGVMLAGAGLAGSGAAAQEADVIVVGAGPAGSATAFYLARAGLDVLMLDKATFPREKVCGDGLTPRAVKALAGMDVGDRRARRLAAQPGPAHHRRWRPPRTALARAVQLSRLWPGADQAGIRRDPRAHGREGGRAVARRGQRDRPGARRCGPHRRGHNQNEPRFRTKLPGPSRRRG